MKDVKKITIVGGGLVGSLLALMLSKKGYQIHVFERRPDIRKAKISAGKSINLALSERGLRALELAGVSDKIKTISIPMSGRQVHPLNEAENFQPYGKDGQFINSVSRGSINQVLLEEAEKTGKVKLHFHAKCIDIQAEKGASTFEDTNTGEIYNDEADLVFAADGAFSAVRYNLQKTDRFNYDQRFLEHGYKELNMPPNENGEWKIKKNALHIWPRRKFMLIALPNLDGSFTCTLFLSYSGAVSFEQLKTEADVKAFFTEYFPDVIPLIPDLKSQFFENPTASLVTVKCYPWVFEDKTTLIGDAAHAIVPFYGQGMNAGFEDCAVLFELLEKHDNATNLLNAFQESRKSNADAIAELAIRNFVEMRDKVADEKFLFRKKIESKLHERFPEHYIPLYSLVTFSHVPYQVALRTGIMQDRFFEKVFKKYPVEGQTDDSTVEKIIEDWMRMFEQNEEKGYKTSV